MRRGTAVSWDHAQLVHGQWFHAARLNMRPYVKRVTSKDNIADLPSRRVGPTLTGRVCCWPAAHVWQEFELLHAMGAVEVVPSLLKEYSDEATWDVLQDRWALHG